MNPVIKWAGGKRRFAETIIKILGTKCNNYYEPFIGGAALLLFAKFANATCSDTNEELINLYNVIKHHPKELIKELSENFVPYHSKEFYYEIRAWDREHTEYAQISNIKRAARFMYLNRTCYNGLWRVNKKGENNVPFGKYVNPTILVEDTILEASQYFNENNVNFEVSDYRIVAERAKKGDIVYFDPPYDVETGQSSFVEYTQERFTRENQQELKELCDILVDRGVTVGISNSNTDFIRSLYTQGKYNFYELHDEIKVKRTIGGTSSSRKELSELFILGIKR